MCKQTVHRNSLQPLAPSSSDQGGLVTGEQSHNTAKLLAMAAS